uniref:Uncharacterized protein n=1 Tax=Cannabis sativa TaxID=3483 RepID=A0A803QGL9_CANSA
MLRVIVCSRNIGTMPEISITGSESPRVLYCTDPFYSVPISGKYIRTVMERSSSSKTACNSGSGRKRQMPETVVAGTGAHPLCHDPPLRLGQPREREVNKALKERLEAEKVLVRRWVAVLSAVWKAEISDDLHILTPAWPTVEVEALEKYLASKVALLAERTAKEADTLVTELEQVKEDNRDLRNANDTLLAELTEAKLLIEGLKKENLLLEANYAY